MFSFFKKDPPALDNFSALEIDFHNHLLPGIDDGAPDVSTSIELMRRMQQLGFKKLICTPHVMAAMYPNTRELILQKKEEMQEICEREGIHWDYFGAAAEYYIDETFVRLLKTEPLLTLPGNRVLVEMSFLQEYPDLHGVLFEMQMKGYKPVLAHPERYTFLKKAADYENLRRLGCEFQVNLLSLTGYYHPSVQAAARLLLQQEWIDFLSSDLHHIRHAEQLQLALRHKTVVQTVHSSLIRNAELAAAL